MVEISEGQVMIVGVKKRKTSKVAFGLGHVVNRVKRDRVVTDYESPHLSRESHTDKTLVHLFEELPGAVSPWTYPYVWTNTYQVVELCDSEEPASCEADKYEKCQYRFRCFTASNKGLDK